MDQLNKSRTPFRHIVLIFVIVLLFLLNLVQYIIVIKIQPLPRWPLIGHYISKKNIIDYFHKISYHDDHTWQLNTWLGIPALQNPNDVWIIQEIITEVKPDYIIDSGTYLGGSALIWATILAQVNPNGKVLTIDRTDEFREGSTATVKEKPIAQRRIDFLLGSSTDLHIIQKISEAVKGKKVLVILDSSHDMNHVLKELRLYSKFVNIGSYIIVQDTNINGNPIYSNDPARPYLSFLRRLSPILNIDGSRNTYGPGPMEAAKKFLDENDDFIIDKNRERLLFTMHPNGYLKRVRQNLE